MSHVGSVTLMSTYWLVGWVCHNFQKGRASYTSNASVGALVNYPNLKYFFLHNFIINI